MPTKAYEHFKQFGTPNGPGVPDALKNGGPMPPMPPAQGGPNAYPGPTGGMPGPGNLPMVPPDYQPPEPEIPDGVMGGKISIGGVDGLKITVNEAPSKNAMLYIHGGGFTIGSGMTAGSLLKMFSEKTGLDCYAVEYGLAPYHTFPEPVEQCQQFYLGLKEMGYENIVVGGESAGAALSLGVTFQLRNCGDPQPAALWLSSPLDDLVMSRTETYMQDMFSACGDAIVEVYAPGCDTTDPRISPIYGDYTDFPPMIIQVGGGESLAAGGVRIAAKAARCNSEVILHFGKDMPHTFAMDYEHYPEAAFAMEEIIAFIKSRLDMIGK